uniref:Uncharacterized protein n=1 Tax=Arundo donax TaxID=35708 RepID=A0A0A9BKG9_ARUDO
MINNKQMLVCTAINYGQDITRSSSLRIDWHFLSLVTIPLS